MISFALMPKYDEYKRTPVDWIESIPSHWNFWRFKYLLKEINIRSTTGSEELLSLSKYKGVIPKDSLAERAGAAESLVGYKKVFINDLVINKMQAVNGLLAVSKMEGVTSPDYSVYRPKDPDLIDYRYLGYLLSMPEYLGEFKRRVTGVMEGFIRLYTDDLFAIYSILPPHNEQALIANFLDKKTAQIDEAIAIKEQQISLLKERKQIIIQQAVTQGLDSNVPMKDSGVDWIGKIPEHWDVLKNRALFNERVEQGKDGLPLLSISIHTGVSSEEVSEEENIRSRVKIEDKTKYILVKPGDVAFNMMRAWQGGIGAVTTEGMVSPAYIVAKPIGAIFAKFFEYQYRCPEFIHQMDRYSKGITDFRKRLYWDSFKQLLTVVPPEPEQVEIIRYIQDVTNYTEAGVSLLNSQIEKLKEYKTTLINSAVTGKIKITPEMVEQ